MHSPELSTLSLPASSLAILQRAGYLTSSEVLLTPLDTLRRKLHLTSSDASSLILQISHALILGKTQTVADILELEGPEEEGEEEREGERVGEWITSGDMGIDELLGGGLRMGSITEVAGQSAAGKSHFALQMAVTAQLPRSAKGVRGGTLFISSEGLVPSGRLLELGKSLIQRLCPDLEGQYDDGMDMDDDGDGMEPRRRSEWDFMDNVHMEKAQDTDTLEALLEFHVPSMITRTLLASTTSPHPRPLPIRLLIIDSIAAPFRATTGTSSEGFISRSRTLGTISDLLHRLSSLHSLAILIINQISDTFPPPSFPYHSNFVNPPHEAYGLPVGMYGRYQTRWFGGESEGVRSIAALGHSWVNTVNTRLMLTRTRRYVRSSEGEGEEGEGEEGGEKVVRRMEMVFSPFAPRASVHYVLEGQGVRSLGGPLRMGDKGF